MHFLAERLCTQGPLCASERELLLTRNYSARVCSPGAVVRMPDDPRLRPTMIVSGWACREKITANGHRQLLSILLPGDLVWHADEQRALDFLDVVAVTRLTVINVAGAMRAIAENPTSFPAITRGLAWLQRADEEQLIEHILRLGSQPAHQRIAGLILELFERCRRIGFVTGGSFVMPLTQESLGNLVGLSVVHVNRVMRRLKAERVIRLSPGMVEILDLDGLARIADVPTADHARAAASRAPLDRCPWEMSAA